MRIERLIPRILGISLVLGVAMLFVAGLFASCEEEVDPYMELDEQARLSAYRQVHYPQAESANEGVFYQVIRQSEGGATVAEGDWIAFDFSVYDLNGMLLQTTVRSIARDNSMTGDRAYFRPRVRRNIAGFWGTTMRGVLSMLRVGDSAVIGMPATVGSRIGLWSQPNRQSVLLHIAIRHSAEEATQYERERIGLFLAKHTGLVAKDSVFRKVLSEGTGKEIVGTSKLSIRYAGYFLDGVLFDTNRPEVAIDHGIYSEKEPYAAYQMVAKDDSKTIRGYSNAFEGLKSGARIQLLVPSELAYKQKGNGPVQPNEPLLFEMEVVSVGD